LICSGNFGLESQKRLGTTNMLNTYYS